MRNSIPFPPGCSIAGLDAPPTPIPSTTHPTKLSHFSINLVDPCLLPCVANVRVLQQEKNEEQKEFKDVTRFPSQKKIVDNVGGDNHLSVATVLLTLQLAIVST